MPRSPTHRRALARSTIISSGKSSSFSESVFKSGGVTIDQVGLAVSPSPRAPRAAICFAFRSASARGGEVMRRKAERLEV